jgi:hypothetical protein
MSYDRTQAIKIFKDVFKNGRITNQLLKQMENDLEQRKKYKTISRQTKYRTCSE